MKTEKIIDDVSVPRLSFSDILNQLKGFKQHTSIGDIFLSLSNRSYGVFFLVLSLPSALPIPAPGYSTPFGIALAGLAIQLLVARSQPWVPQKALDLRLSPGFLSKLCSALGFVLKFSEKFVRPRWRYIIYPLGTQLAGLSILIMASLMILPIPGTNTFPAGVIFLTGLALIEEDGLLMLGSLLLGVLATIFYLTLIVVIYTYGLTGIGEAWRFLTNF